MTKQKVMAVVRGVQPRMAEIYFYSHFKNIKIRFIGDKKTGWVVEDKIPKNIEFINLPLKPAWFIDPVTLFGGFSHSHQSWKYVANLEKYVNDVDIINISDMFYFYSGQCAYLSKKLDKKLVSIVWETIPNHISTYLPPYSFNVRSVLRNADLFIARSKTAKIYLDSIGVNEEKIKVIYKGIELKNFYPDFNYKPDKIRILYVGQLVESKGINELLEAFVMLCKKFTNLELWICAKSLGEPMEKKVRDMVGKYPVMWLGNITYDKLPEIYRKCQIYCQLSQDWKYFGLLTGGNDWFPYTIIEAMASGLPIVTTNVGGIPEQVDTDNIFVKQKNVVSAYNGLKELILNPKKRLLIGRKNTLRVKRLFDIKKQAEDTENAILEII
ncbi:MAG: glycosyltransferase family 4 protein [Candidatus Levybacteria bacterium]|nr:glycosyltransferase family 4 protein [Candidatus Levybacteria bacterium]